VKEFATCRFLDQSKKDAVFINVHFFKKEVQEILYHLSSHAAVFKLATTNISTRIKISKGANQPTNKQINRQTDRQTNAARTSSLGQALYLCLFRISSGVIDEP